MVSVKQQAPCVLLGVISSFLAKIIKFFQTIKIIDIIKQMLYFFCLTHFKL